MSKRGGDDKGAARSASAKARVVINEPPDDMVAEAAAPAPAAAELQFVTPAVFAEPAARASKRRVEVQSPKTDSPTRPRPGRSSPPALGGQRAEGAGDAPRRARAGDPAPASPPPGCSTDALRIHIELVIKGFEQALGHQAQQQAEAQDKIQKLEANLRTVHEELTADAKENHDKVKTEVFSLRIELSSFAAGLQEINATNTQAIDKIERIDRMFKEHLDVAFVCVEVKCASLNSAIDELESRIPMRAPRAPSRCRPACPPA